MFDRIELYIELLKTDPVNFLIYLFTLVVAVLMSLILHECAHGYVALQCGDPTAKMLGRLSLNPLRHLDPIGTVCMFLLGFGWAKPVPVNPRNFRSFRRDDFLVSIAGIVTNLTLFVTCTLLAVTLNRFMWSPEFAEAVPEVFGGWETATNVFGTESYIAQTIAYGLNYDFMELYMPAPWLCYIQRFFFMMMQINLGLALFNLLPIPPLDGYHILNDTLLKGKLHLSEQMFQLTRLALFALIFFTDVLDVILNKGSELIGTAVVRTFLMLFGQL